MTNTVWRDFVRINFGPLFGWTVPNLKPRVLYYSQNEKLISEFRMDCRYNLLATTHLAGH